jgi:hypothetical protein
LKKIRHCDAHVISARAAAAVDGIPDLAVTNSENPSSNLGILLGKGDGSFKSPVTYLASDSLYAVVAGDFNGDGNQDLPLTRSPIDQGKKNR